MHGRCNIATVTCPIVITESGIHTLSEWEQRLAAGGEFRQLDTSKKKSQNKTKNNQCVYGSTVKAQFSPGYNIELKYPGKYHSRIKLTSMKNDISLTTGIFCQQR